MPRTAYLFPALAICFLSLASRPAWAQAGKGDGSVRGEGREELHLGGHEGMRQQVVADEHAVNHLPAGDRHGEIGAGRLLPDEGLHARGVLERGPSPDRLVSASAPASATCSRSSAAALTAGP